MESLSIDGATRNPAEATDSHTEESVQLVVGPGRPKAIIAGVHLLPLPGSPAYDRDLGVRPIVARARREIAILAEHGVSAILFANEADTPYQTALGPGTVAAFTDVVCEAIRDVRLPFGINALLDSVAGIAIAHATGASFVRGYLAGVYATDSGLMDTHGSEVLRLRASLSAQSILIFHNLVCAFGAPIAPRTIGDEARGALVHGRVDGFTISGPGGGRPPALEQFCEVRNAVPDAPLLAGTGIDADNVRPILEVADGVIVVTSLRIGRQTLNPLEPARVAEFMARVRGVEQAP